MTGKRDKVGRPSQQRPAQKDQGRVRGIAVKNLPAGITTLPARWSLMLVLASLFGILMGVAVVALDLISAAQPPKVSTTAGTTGAVGNQGADRRSKGSANAPVVITEWSDYQCPACRVFALTRESALDEPYVKTSKVRIVYRNYAFLGPESFWAAEAAEAAADQGRYLEYRNLLWQRQKGENQGTFKIENLKAWAAELGLDMKKFNSSLDGHVYKDAIVAEEKEGETLGIKATPTIMINGRIIDGVPSVDKMKSLIEEELAKKR
ncbi:MAG TPA: thioredoxin domain-containing protein [Chloroflexota bacterium]|nr:thioredoxin domain-containing protein [Chloroflexota bacterium]